MALLIFSMPDMLAIKIGHKFTKENCNHPNLLNLHFSEGHVEKLFVIIKAAGMFLKSTDNFCITQQNNGPVSFSMCGDSCSLFLQKVEHNCCIK